MNSGSTLGEIAERCTSLGEAATRRQLGGGPFLVVYPWEDSGKSAFDTCLMTDDELLDDEATDPASATLLDERLAGRGARETVKARASAVSMNGANALVLPVSKSSRNPFSNLITLGRARNNDLILSSPSVSKVHAWFLDGGPSGWFLQDNGSTNGTTHNDEPAAPRVNLTLRFGDTVGFGGVQAVFCDAAGVLELAQRW